MNRKVWSVVQKKRPTIWKVIKEFFGEIRKLFRKRWQYDSDTIWMEKNFPPIPPHILKDAEINAYTSWMHITIPFQFELEKKIVKWWESYADDPTTNTTKDETVGYSNGDFIHGHHDENDEWVPGVYEKVPYAKRTYKLYRNETYYDIAVIFDSRKEGSTCYVQELEPEVKAQKAVMEIVCGKAVEAGELF